MNILFLHICVSVRHLLHMRKRASESVPVESTAIHDSHKYGVHTNYMTPSLHFHLAVSINASTGNVTCSVQLAVVKMFYIVGSEEVV
jgi:hypothetical protein